MPFLTPRQQRRCSGTKLMQLRMLASPKCFGSQNAISEHLPTFASVLFSGDPQLASFIIFLVQNHPILGAG